MKTTPIISGLLLLSFTTLAQTIIPQKSDTTQQKQALEYFGDKAAKPAEKKPTQDPLPSPGDTATTQEAVSTPDTIQTRPVVVKYYEATDAPEKAKNEKPQRDKNQIKTLTGRMSHSGGYAAVSFKSSDFLDKTLVMGGLRGAWVVNRTLAIGVDMYGIIPTAKYQGLDANDATNKVRLLGGYGGLMLEPIFFSNEVVHITFPVSAGAGWLGLEDPDGYDQWGRSDKLMDQDVFWYIEPGANLEVNIARNFRLDFGISRRFTQDLQLMQVDADEFDGINYYLSLKIGRF